MIKRYLHFNIEKNILRCPGYHQLDLILKIEKDIKNNPSKSKNYLIQHSPGSGKSFTISLLANRLSSMHYFDNKKVYSSVIIITNRIVLDNQLHENIYNVSTEKESIKHILNSSKDLKSAILNSSPTIVTTIQKFIYIYKELSQRYEHKKYAVIVDEAHSYQTGVTSLKMKDGLDPNILKFEPSNYIDKFYKIISNKNINISFFAFTATPKKKHYNFLDLKIIMNMFHIIFTRCSRQ